MKILITGGAGFIGHHVARTLSKNAEIIILDDLSSGKKERLESIPCKLICGHVEDSKLVLQAAKECDAIIHLAAFLSVAESIQKPAACIETNILGTLHVLEASRLQPKKPHVILASSSAVYGATSSSIQSEEMSCAPMSAYAASKYQAEMLCHFYHQTYGVPTSILRFFNVYGPGQSFEGAYAAAIPKWVNHAIKGESITLFGDGSQTRDFIHVRDIVQAIELLLKPPYSSHAEGPFNIGGGEVISMRYLAEKIIQTAQSNSKIVYQPQRSGEVIHSCANISRIQKLGFTPQVTLQDGLKELVATMRAQ